MLFITRPEEINIEKSLQALYFYASYIPQHKKFLTMIENVDGKINNLFFYAIDAEQFSSQCKRFSVKSVPTIIILGGGLEIDRIKARC